MEPMLAVDNGPVDAPKIRFTLNQKAPGRGGGIEILKGVQVQMVFDNNINCIYMQADGSPLVMRVHLKEPDDFLTVRYWRVYSTHWSNFAAYGDERNSNQAYELEAFVSIARQEQVFGSKAMEDDAKYIEDMMHILFQYLGKKPQSDDDEKRVSHLLYGTKGKPAIFETCNMRPIKKKGEYGWKFF